MPIAVKKVVKKVVSVKSVQYTLELLHDSEKSGFYRYLSYSIFKDELKIGQVSFVRGEDAHEFVKKLDSLGIKVVQDSFKG